MENSGISYNLDCLHDLSLRHIGCLIGKRQGSSDICVYSLNKIWSSCCSYTT